MKLTRTMWPLFATVLAAALTAGAARAEEPADLKEKVLKLNSITGDEPVANKVRELVKDKAGTEKLLKTAEDMVKLNSKQFQYPGAVILARSAAGLKNYDLSLRFFKLCGEIATKVKSASKMEEAYQGQIIILLEQKKYSEAEKVAQSFMELQGDEKLEEAKLGVVELLVTAKTRQGKITDAMKIVDALNQEFKGEWYFTQLKARVLFDAGKLEDSVKAYTETLDLLSKAERMKPAQQEAQTNRIRYILSSVYVELNQIDKAAEQLQTLLKKKPDSPSFNNDLGYIWADHDMNLDESEKLIRKALDEDRKLRSKDKDLTKDEDKDKPEYLDSLGWVLFKKKQFAEAKKPLLEAVKDPDGGQHIEIFDHLADVHMALGEKAEAIAVWKKALDLDVSGKRDQKRQQEVVKKLKAAEGK